MDVRRELNPIVLSHVNRFLAAATLAVQSSSAQDERTTQALAQLSGNMLWASSPFVAAGREDEQARAYSGALMGAMSELARGSAGAKGPAAALAEVERSLRAGHDALLDLLARDLDADAVERSTPAGLNAAVWKRLFPEFSYELTLTELSEAIGAWLRASARR